jgi:hypothetical protein
MKKLNFEYDKYEPVDGRLNKKMFPCPLAPG